MKIEAHVLESIKRLHLPTLIQGYGITLHKNGWFNRTNSYKILCPFHDDKTPSLHLSEKNGKWIWNCFGCGARGNTFDFLMKMDKSDFNGTYIKYGGQFVGAVPPAPVVVPSPIPVNGNGYHAPTVNRAELLAKVAEHYHQAFLEDRRGVEYLAGRGIQDPDAFKTFRVGFANGRLKKVLPDDPNHEFVTGLEALGVLNEKGNEHFYGCVVFPITDENGAAVGLYGRRIAAGEPAHLYLAGPRRGVWNGAAAKAYPDLVVTEKIIDALSLYAVGIKNVVPLYGTNGLTEDHLRLFREHRTKSVTLCLDNDAAGDRARPEITDRLKALGIEVADFLLPKRYKDINDALVQGFPADELRVLSKIDSVLANAKKVPELFFPNPPPADPIPGQAPDSRPPSDEKPREAKQSWPQVERKEDAIFIRFPERVYRVTGLAAKTRLRMTLRVEQADGWHLDSLDLYSAKSRAAFAACCRKIFPANEGELLRELNQIIEALEVLQAESPGDKTEEKPMDPAEAAETLAFLKRPQLLADILRDMDELGYVGEDHNKAIGYLVGTSRLLEAPLACSILSQSSAGKSVLADTVEKMMPPEGVLSLSRATPNAFFYITKGGVKHKCIIMEERAGAESADYAIRTLQSKKKLSQVVTIKDEQTGDMKAKFFEVEGPVAYIETTTHLRIHDENATRCFEITLDESLEQTLRIQRRQRESKTLDGLNKKSQTDRIIRRHHALQRLLKPVMVVIPYALLIDFPARWLRTRRDNLRFLNLIEVICFLHQHQRPMAKAPDGADYIEATLSDYEAAYALAQAVMGESLAELKKPQRDVLKAAMALAAKNGDGVTRRQLRESTGLAHTRLREIVADLAALEYLLPVDGGPGKPFLYRLGELPPENGGPLTGLTPPNELKQKMHRAGLL